MNFDELFEAYYTIYRMEAETPASTEDEYTVALRLANEAANRWEYYDNTLWKTLYQTLQVEDDGDTTISTGVTEYECPANMLDVGGNVVVKNSNGSLVQTYKIIEPSEVQFQAEFSSYAYFTGDPSNGFILHLSSAPTSEMNGMDIDYVYYKKSSKFTSGSDFTECPDSYFLVHRMLYQRFKGSRNPFQQSAKNDAENALKQMQMTNNSGTPANPWNMPDHSGSSFGG